MKSIIPLLKNRLKSESIYRAACSVIPKGVNSPIRAFCGLEIVPLVAASGKGDIITDADGNSYIDLCCSWGALIHGHAHPQIVEAAQTQIALGSTFGITTESEVWLASKICSLVPSVDQVRFVSSGTEATMSAIRLARSYTGKDLIVKFSGNYHGHADPFLVEAGSGVLLTPQASSTGVPYDTIKHTRSLPYNDIEACTELFTREGQNIAAVIVEPVAGNMGVVLPAIGFLETLRALTESAGALLIFDEVITGFRLGCGGAQALYGIGPDLTCFGKVIGGGFPAAAFGGKKEIMECLSPLGPVFQAGTLSGNPVAMCAGYTALTLCELPFFYATLEEKQERITLPVIELIQKKNLPVCVNAIGSLFTIFFGQRRVSSLEEAKRCDASAFKHFFQTMFENGIYFSPSQFEANFISAAHSEKNLVYIRDTLLNYFDVY